MRRAGEDGQLRCGHAVEVAVDIAAAALVGILLGPLAAAFRAATAASHRWRARRRVVTAVDAVLQRPVLEPVAADLNRARAVGAAQKIASA